jgi:hypothetical protein
MKADRTMIHYIPYVGTSKDFKSTYDSSKVTCEECLKMLKKEREQ